MIFYITLTCSTLIIILITLHIWRNTNDISLPIGIFFLYYWSLFGAWIIVYDHINSITGHENDNFGYYYLYDKLFNIHLDNTYLLSIIYYSLFIIIIISSLAIYTSKHKVNTCFNAFVISPILLCVFSLASCIISYLILRNTIYEAYNSGGSLYSVSRSIAREGGLLFFTISQLLNRLAALSISFGIAIFLSGRSSIYFKFNSYKKTIFFIFLLLGIVLFTALAILGNKNELFLASIFGVLLYSANTKKTNYKYISLSIIFLVILVSTVNGIRSISFSATPSAQEIALKMFQAFTKVYASNEAFAAHFSMYGVLINDVPYTYGSSIVTLFTSIIPRFIWPDRPLDIYYYYVNSISASYGQGYTIHHATAWYLNFGFVGIILGAFIFSALWGYLIHRFYKAKGRGSFSIIFSIMGPIGLVAGTPSFIRGGPESYKGLIIECFIIPTFILLFSIKRKIRF